MNSPCHTIELDSRIAGYARTARRYCDEEHRAWVTETSEHVIVWFRWDNDGNKAAYRR
jgi:hypothetical protein